MKINIKNTCSDYDSYRAARVKSLFNAESGCNFELEADLPVEEPAWSLGVIVGPSGSGKSSLGKKIWGGQYLVNFDESWPKNKPIIDAISPDGDFNIVTGALSAVGLGSVPSWLRPYSVLSAGEKFRAGLARVIAKPPDKIIIDEFTSVVDRQIARFGALAFGKSWRRAAEPSGKQCIILSCHYDILEWLEPDWFFDTKTGKVSMVRLRRPKFELEIWKTGWRYWPMFEPHHYLKVPPMVASQCYVGLVDGEFVCHLALSSRNKGKDVEARACRLVVMPEWQGAGVGLKFLNQICEWNLHGAPGGRFPGRPVTTVFHTSHPGLAAALRRDYRWRQVSAKLYGDNKRRCIETLKRTSKGNIGSGFGGHFRAVQGFRYVGECGKGNYEYIA